MKIFRIRDNVCCEYINPSSLLYMPKKYINRTYYNGIYIYIAIHSYISIENRKFMYKFHRINDFATTRLDGMSPINIYIPIYTYAYTQSFLFANR